MTIHLWAAAHEHLMAELEIILANGKIIKQLSDGGGGADLKSLVNDPNNYPFSDQDRKLITSVSSRFYAKLHGFIELTITAKEIKYQPYLIKRDEKGLPTPKKTKVGVMLRQHYCIEATCSAISGPVIGKMNALLVR